MRPSGVKSLLPCLLTSLSISSHLTTLPSVVQAVQRMLTAPACGAVLRFRGRVSITCQRPQSQEILQAWIPAEVIQCQNECSQINYRQVCVFITNCHHGQFDMNISECRNKSNIPLDGTPSQDREPRGGGNPLALLSA